MKHILPSTIADRHKLSTRPSSIVIHASDWDAASLAVLKAGGWTVRVETLGQDWMRVMLAWPEPARVRGSMTDCNQSQRSAKERARLAVVVKLGKSQGISLACVVNKVF